MSLCRNLKSEYESLKTLTQEFVSACTDASGRTALTPTDVRTVSDDQLRALQLLKQRVETARDALKNKLFVSPETAREIMGKDHVFSREEIRTAFGINIPTQDLPPIRWSTQELKDAQKRGDYLIYRPSTYLRDTAIADTAPIPLTMQNIAELVQPTLTVNNQGKARYDGNDWCENEPFYTQEKPRSGWVLVSKEPLSDSTDKNYVQQTDRIVEELSILYPATDQHPIAKIYHKAIEEFREQRAGIQQLMKENKRQDASKRLAALSITTLTRHTAPEAYYDAMLLRASIKHDSLLSNIYTWTSTRSSSGDLVNVGVADISGACVGRWDPGARFGYLGVLFVRSGPVVSRSS